MIIKFASFVLDVDVQRTRAFYERADIPTMSQQCDCINCQNFDEAILKASDKVLDFLLCFGIDPQKPIETFNVPGCLEKEGTIWYNGWYHICGTIVEGPETVKKALLPDGREHFEFSWDLSYAPDNDFPFKAIPVQMSDLLHEEFPAPVIQLEFDTHLPYVLQIPYYD